MLKKYFIFLFVVIIEIIIQLDISYTQPYIYYSKVKDGSPTNADIYRIDIQSGDSVLFMPNMGSISTLVWNGDQTLLFVRSRSHLYVFELNNKNKRHHLTNDIFNNLCIFDAEKINKVFITYESRGGEEVKTVVINRTTCEVSDTIKMFSPIDNLCFSDDEKTIYRSVSDSTGFIFESIDAISYSIIQDRKRCGTLGSFAFVPGIDDAKKDKVLLSYEVIPGFLYQKYVLCNPDLGITYQPISFPMRSRGYLTYNTKYVILEQVNWDATLVNLEYRPGNVCVFDAISGQLITQLSLPPEGKILFFKNYPDIIFYYLPNERRSIKIDISELANIKVFNPTFAYAGSAAFILTINGKNFTSGSIVNWNGVAKATTYMSDSVLHANILASDIAVLDSPLVTVKSADGLTESNGMRFYVKQQPVISGCIVKLVSSTGIKLTGGTLQYYDGSWKDAVNNNDGTFFINTTKTSLSLRMTYEYGTQTKSNVSISSDTVVFQTVNAKVQLQNSNGITMDTGSVQYYAGAWRVFGTTVNGTASKELLPNNYSFRMTYAYASNDKKQDLNTNPTVIFQTVNTTVQLQNSQGNLIDEGLVKYYSGAWREFGTTVNGTASKELLPNNYSFRMTYEYASNDKKQDLNTNPTVVFQTVNAAVQLQNSQGTLIDQGTVQYYSGAWRTFGTTTNGTANKELLPNNYSFRMTYEYASNDKKQDLNTNPIVVFQTVNAAVQLQNSQGTLIDQGTVQYYSGAWRTFGITTNGTANKELLPNNYSFRMTYAYASNDMKQDLNTNPIVVFQTVNAKVQLQNSNGVLIDTGTVKYYAGAWRDLGATVNGTASKELLPNNYSFRMTYEYGSIDKKQDLSANNTVVFSTVLCTIRVKNTQNEQIDGAMASYYSGAWRQIGLTVNGEITKELLPLNLSFRVKFGTQQQDKQQNISTNNIVEFTVQ